MGPQNDDFIYPEAPPSTAQIANLVYRWKDVLMPLVYKIPMPIIDKLIGLCLVVPDAERPNTYLWEDKGLKDSLRESIKGLLFVPPDDPILHVIRPLVNSAESVKFEQTKGSRQQYGKTVPTLYTTIEIVNHGPTSEHPKSE